MKEAIVVAGGDSARRFQLSNNLESDQYNVNICQSPEEFRITCGEAKIVAFLLLYPDESGIISKLFDRNVMSKLIGRSPVVIISSSSTENNRARSLYPSADEFLIESISPRELVEFVNELVGSSVKNDRHHILTIGDLVLDRTSLTVTLRNVKLPLYPLQVRILEFLMLTPGRIFTRLEIANGIWSAHDSIDDRTIDVSIGRIRDALRHKVAVDPIRTVRSVGYAFNEHFGEIASLPKKGRAMKREL